MGLDKYTSTQLRVHSKYNFLKEGRSTIKRNRVWREVWINVLAVVDVLSVKVCCGELGELADYGQRRGEGE